jgi:hypothetical protein
LGMKPQMHLVETIIFSLYHVTKIIKDADKNWANFFGNKAF